MFALDSGNHITGDIRLWRTPASLHSQLPAYPAVSIDSVFPHVGVKTIDIDRMTPTSSTVAQMEMEAPSIVVRRGGIIARETDIMSWTRSMWELVIGSGGLPSMVDRYPPSTVLLRVQHESEGVLRGLVYHSTKRIGLFCMEEMQSGHVR